MVKISQKSYRKYYEDPISVAAGETVTWIEKESEWAGWTWCIHPVTKKAGWVPNVAIQKKDNLASVLKSYSAAELNAEMGEPFEVLNEESGWYWCRNQRNEMGWLPLEIFDA